MHLPHSVLLHSVPTAQCTYRVVYYYTVHLPYSVLLHSAPTPPCTIAQCTYCTVYYRTVHLLHSVPTAQCTYCTVYLPHSAPTAQCTYCSLYVLRTLYKAPALQYVTYVCLSVQPLYLQPPDIRPYFPIQSHVTSKQLQHRLTIRVSRVTENTIPNFAEQGPL